MRCEAFAFNWNEIKKWTLGAAPSQAFTSKGPNYSFSNAFEIHLLVVSSEWPASNAEAQALVACYCHHSLLLCPRLRLASCVVFRFFFQKGIEFIGVLFSALLATLRFEPCIERENVEKRREEKKSFAPLHIFLLRIFR